jgi:predicted transport protein
MATIPTPAVAAQLATAHLTGDSREGAKVHELLRRIPLRLKPELEVHLSHKIIDWALETNLVDITPEQEEDLRQILTATFRDQVWEDVSVHPPSKSPAITDSGRWENQNAMLEWTLEQLKSALDEKLMHEEEVNLVVANLVEMAMELVVEDSDGVDEDSDPEHATRVDASANSEIVGSMQDVDPADDDKIVDEDYDVVGENASDYEELSTPWETVMRLGPRIR